VKVVAVSLADPVAEVVAIPMLTLILDTVVEPRAARLAGCRKVIADPLCKPSSKASAFSAEPAQRLKAATRPQMFSAAQSTNVDPVSAVSGELLVWSNAVVGEAACTWPIIATVSKAQTKGFFTVSLLDSCLWRASSVGAILIRWVACEHATPVYEGWRPIGRNKTRIRVVLLGSGDKSAKAVGSR
jgi:hypothetical protein